jgi:hypothetical protein
VWWEDLLLGCTATGFFFVLQEPISGLGCHIVEIPRSHTIPHTHTIRHTHTPGRTPLNE